jgi:hypothetical protein
MNLGNGGGSFTGNFTDFQLNGASRFRVTAGGEVLAAFFTGTTTRNPLSSITI